MYLVYIRNVVYCTYLFFILNIIIDKNYCRGHASVRNSMYTKTLYEIDTVYIIRFEVDQHLNISITLIYTSSHATEWVGVYVWICFCSLMYMRNVLEMSWHHNVDLHRNVLCGVSISSNFFDVLSDFVYFSWFWIRAQENIVLIKCQSYYYLLGLKYLIYTDVCLKADKSFDFFISVRSSLYLGSLNWNKTNWWALAARGAVCLKQGFVTL